MSPRGPLEWLTKLLLEYSTRPLVVDLKRQFGVRPNQRDLAEKFGRTVLRRALSHNREVVFDFHGTGLITQGFFHALLDDVVTEDPRRAGRIRLSNVTTTQKAVFDLAMRYMVHTASSRRRDVPPVPAQIVHTT